MGNFELNEVEKENQNILIDSIKTLYGDDIEYKIQYLIQLENNISNYTLLNVTISQKIIKINEFIISFVLESLILHILIDKVIGLLVETSFFRFIILMILTLFNLNSNCVNLIFPLIVLCEKNFLILEIVINFSTCLKRDLLT